MKTKVLFTVIIFTLSTHTTNCMKRSLENAQERNAKRIKYNEKPSLSAEDSKLYSLLQREYEHSIQLKLLHAIEKKNIPDMTQQLIKQPKHTFLEWTVATQFWQGTNLILQLGKPTESELRRSLEVAIRTKNIPLMDNLLTKNARLDTKSRADSHIKEILYKNSSIVDILLDYGLTFIGAINMDLSVDTIEYVIKKTKPSKSELDRALTYTNKKNYLHISYLLIAIKGN